MKLTKRLLTVLLSFTFVMALFVQTESSVISATSSPPITIRTAAELQAINENLSGNFVLFRYIDLQGINFTPIGSQTAPFTGTFYGSGHGILNLTGTGLFGYTRDATIRNATITNAFVSGCAYVGILIGHSVGGTVEDISVSGTIWANSYVGGLIGYIDGTTVKRSSSQIWMHGSYKSGGLIGHARGGSIIEDCYAIAEISGYLYAGGLIGYAEPSVRVTNCYVVGLVEGPHKVMELASPPYHSPIITNSYFFCMRNPPQASMQQSTFVGWDFEYVWYIFEREAFPQLRHIYALPSPGLSYTDVTANSITLEWAHDRGVSYHDLYINGNIIRIETFGEPVILTGLSANTQYVIRVRGINDFGVGIWSQRIIVTTSIS